MYSCNNLSALTQQQYNPIYQKILKPNVKSYGIVEHGDVPYSITNRGYDALYQSTYPAKYLDDLKTEMRILDVGTGDGHLVEDLRNKGFTGAEGIDIGDALPKDKPYLKQVALEDTTFPDNTFDRIFSSYSIFAYPESAAFQQLALEKMAAMLKPDGQIRLAPLNSLVKLKRIAAKVPTLRITDEGPGNRYVQLTKLDPKHVSASPKKGVNLLA